MPATDGDRLRDDLAELETEARELKETCLSPDKLPKLPGGIRTVFDTRGRVFTWDRGQAAEILRAWAKEKKERTKERKERRRLELGYRLRLFGRRLPRGIKRLRRPAHLVVRVFEALQIGTLFQRTKELHREKMKMRERRQLGKVAMRVNDLLDRLERWWWTLGRQK